MADGNTKNHKKKYFCLKENRKIYIRGHLISRIEGTRETREINGSRILMGLQYPIWQSFLKL